MGEDFDTLSHNVDASGMFSIQVLQKALAVHNLDIIPLSSPDSAAAKSDPSSQTAFLCNLDEHWFTIKKVYDEWWNFDSTKIAPAPVGNFYLSAFLATLQEQGYSIFVVQGDLPNGPHQDMGAEDMNQGKWFSPQEAREASKKSENVKKQGFARAAASALLGRAAFGGGATYTLRPRGQPSRIGNSSSASYNNNRQVDSNVDDDDGDDDDDDDDDDLAKALAASMEDVPPEYAAAIVGGNKRQRGGVDVGAFKEGEDDDLAAAIAASLQGSRAQQEEGEEDMAVENTKEGNEDAYKLPELNDDYAGDETDGGVIEVGLRLPGGRRCVRKFHRGRHTIGHLVAFAAKEEGGMVSPGRMKLALQFPHRDLSDWGVSLEEAGIGDKELVVVLLK
jgi:ataxin-3